jgi:transcriptional regulator with XRE-family HTH domain
VKFKEKNAFEGHRMQDLRFKKKIGQLELAKMLGFTKTTISNYECNVSSPSCSVLKKLCSILDTSSDYLLGLAEEPKASSHLIEMPEKYKNLKISEIELFEKFDLVNMTIQEISDMISILLIYVEKHNKYKNL